MKVSLPLPDRRAVSLILTSLTVLPLLGCPTPTTQTSTPVGSASPSATGGFHDRAKEAGLNYQWTVTESRPLNILGTIGNGCAFLDFDSDGNLDILLVGPKPALFLGDGKGKFQDVSTQTGLSALSGRYLGCAIGDVNSDGRPDIYLTAYRGGTLLQNVDGKTLRDSTKTAGIPSQPWTTAAAFLDANGDGNLDLYLGNYVQFGPHTIPQLCASDKLKTSCGPRYYDPEGGRLFIGNGKGVFHDGTSAAGLQYLKKSAEAIETSAKLSGKCLGVAVADYDDSGRPGIALSNDEMPGDLLQNKGKGRFANIGQLSGTAYDREGGMHGGMGIDWGDIDNDLKLDLFVGTFQNEPKCLYVNTGQGLFEERGETLGLLSARPYVTFGSKFLDFNNDGWLDLIFCNGHVQDNIDLLDKAATYPQPTILFQNSEGEHFEDVSAKLLNSEAQRKIVGRGLAVGDYDNDGKVDVLIVDSEGEPLLLHNETASEGNWIGFSLSQPIGGNRDVYGAVVTIEAEGKKQIRHCRVDGSYMSSSDPRLHFGIGTAKQVDAITIRWPDGKTERVGPLSSGRYYKWEHGKSPQ